MLSVKFLLVLFCCVQLIVAELPDSNQLQASTKEHIDSANYGPLIAQIQNELTKLNLDEISAYGAEIANAKTQLNKLRNRMATYEDLVHSTNNANNAHTLITRMETIEADTALVTDEIASKMSKLSASMSREISDNTKRLEMIEESVERGIFQIKEMRNALEKISQNVKTVEKRHENAFKSIKSRFESIEQAINSTNDNLQFVYESTVGAAVDRLMEDIWTYLGYFEAYCVKLIDWFYEICAYIIFWWMEAIQPAIIRQATNLYFGAQKFVCDSIDSVHSNVIYSELMKQSQVYLDMANIASDYNGYIIDAILLLFCGSLLITLKCILGFCCDCCCPRIRNEVRSDRKRSKSKRKVKPKNKRPKQNTTRSV